MNNPALRIFSGLTLSLSLIACGGDSDVGTDSGSAMDSGDSDTSAPAESEIANMQNYVGYSDGDTVSVTATVTTPNAGYGFFMQDASAAHAGIWVYQGSDAELFPSQGDRVEVTGTLFEFNDLTEIDAGSEGGLVVVVGSAAVPAPITVSKSDLADPAFAERYESVLITIEDVTVATEADEYGEWVTGSGLSVDDKFLSNEEGYVAPGVGEVFSAMTGPLDYTYGAFKLVPRGASDFAQ